MTGDELTTIQRERLEVARRDYGCRPRGPDRGLYLAKKESPWLRPISD
jgi:hypothetical protein